MLKPHTQALFDEYTSSHQHPTNRLTHKIAIPLIVLHIVAMLDWVRLVSFPLMPGGELTLAHVAWVLASIWYLRADAKLGGIVSVAMAFCIPLGRALPGGFVVAIAIGGWLVQLAGHAVWEKKSPSFFTNLVHALVGPLFFVALLTGDYKLGAQAQAAPQSAR
ncbi:Mpo1 family 2-hydroxy fatty acid dioxygenase [Archangium lipolyticum]|uniref:Mpo1 family 2-hydroxy fatty acid dioxygenase n=1 Tax=Archangium lipolyticum TaxID=2970465 RepID=UPI002149CCB9|nr:Mpo1-like protein [Archangium lipolyticum]